MCPNVSSSHPLFFHSLPSLTSFSSSFNFILFLLFFHSLPFLSCFTILGMCRGCLINQNLRKSKCHQLISTWHLNIRVNEHLKKEMHFARVCSRNCFTVLAVEVSLLRNVFEECSSQQMAAASVYLQSKNLISSSLIEIFYFSYSHHLDLSSITHFISPPSILSLPSPTRRHRIAISLTQSSIILFTLPSFHLNSSPPLPSAYFISPYPIIVPSFPIINLNRLNIIGLDWI